MDSENYKRHLDGIKQKLDEVSPSFCVAKWKQVTIHLQNGQTHSCHHPRTHTIPIEEIKINPSALHNTSYKKLQRKMMLEGERPSECDYCWRVEDQSKDVYSDRVYKSGDPWAVPYIEDISKKAWDENIDPSYVEVSFGNVCNFKCSYCAPHISSQWMEEIERYGPYPTSGNFNNLEWIESQDMMPIPNKEDNPYVDAFWSWFPKMYKELKHFRITGGEPLLNKNTFKVLDYIIENPNTDLDVSINTNMNAPDELMDKFLEKLKLITDGKKLKKIKIFTSAEAHGKQSEYIRYGMNYDKWLSNLHKTYETIPGIQFTIMSTYNLLSVTSYIRFLDDVLDIKRKYGTIGSKTTPVLLDIPYLRYPEHQTVFLADESMLAMIHDQVEHMYNNLESKDSIGFYKHEADKLKRIYEMAKNSVGNKDLDVYRKDFIEFVDEHDYRRDTKFLETFPEFANFYIKCRNLL